MYVEIAFACVLFLLARFASGRGGSRPGSIRNHSTYNPKLFHEPTLGEALNVLIRDGSIANPYAN